MKRPDPTTATPPTAAIPAAELTHAGDAPRLALRPKAAARALDIGERLLWSMTNRGEIPHVRLGKRVLYPVAELERWLAERAQQKGRPHG
jgi:excisionase family DNA binding protein